MPTTVVNIKHEKCDVYCGRPSLYGNPFRVGKDGTRVDVILKYIDYFFERMRDDPVFKKKILELKDKKLGCYCAPETCHCDVIAEYLNIYPYYDAYYEPVQDKTAV